MEEKAIRASGLVLVTGVNGYIASHIADQLLGRGYAVRGTARDQQKLDMIGETLRRRHTSAVFEGIVLNDMTVDGAFDQAVAGCDGVLHVATDVSFDPNPNEVVPKVVKMTRSILAAAARTSTVKRFVLTSSSIAAVHPVPNVEMQVNSSSWNETDLEAAWAPPPYLPSRAFSVYAASKFEAERAAWDFVKTQQPAFVFNAVLPYFTVGPSLNAKQSGSTSGWVRGLFEGDPNFTKMLHEFPPQWNVDVRDVALLHVAALLEKDIQNERVLAFAERFNYSRIVKILSHIDSSRNFPPAPEDEGEDLCVVDTTRAIELLQRMGRSNMIGLEESLGDQLAA